MSATTIAVTEVELNAITPALRVVRNIHSDSQFVPTPADMIVRELGRAAFALAWTRHNDWHTRWEAATTDADRAAVIAECEAAERGMKRVRLNEGWTL
jgi:hypothetical protein